MRQFFQWIGANKSNSMIFAALWTVIVLIANSLWIDQGPRVATVEAAFSNYILGQQALAAYQLDQIDELQADVIYLREKVAVLVDGVAGFDG
jgi:hypothetical protein